MSSSRIARAILAGIIAGFIVAFLLFLADHYFAWTVSWGFWGVLVGILAAIVAYAENSGPHINA